MHNDNTLEAPKFRFFVPVRPLVRDFDRAPSLIEARLAQKADLEEMLRQQQQGRRLLVESCKWPGFV